MIKLPKNATREIDEIVLTRYASYLIAQNGYLKKDQIAFTQSYFPGSRSRTMAELCCQGTTLTTQ